MGMTTEQEKHLAFIQKKFAEALDTKYRQGVEEHGGNIWDKQDMLMDEMMFEILDLWVYYATKRWGAGNE